MRPEEAETDDTTHTYEWNERAIASMWEVYGISRETIIRMQEIVTRFKTIPKEEQLRALDWIVQEIAKQRDTGTREICYSILGYHPLDVMPPRMFFTQRDTK